MFSKTDKTMPAPPVAGDGQLRGAKRGGVPSIISEDLRIVGSLSSDGEIQIDGTVEGNISGHIVTVSKGASIEGSIVANTVHVSGTVSGQIEAGSVMIAKPARVTGDILHQSLAIEAGAHVEGYCRPREANVAAKVARVEKPAAPVEKIPPVARVADLKSAPTDKKAEPAPTRLVGAKP